MAHARTDAGEVVLALLGGAALGVGAGLLLAPTEGADAREHLRRWAGQVGERSGRRLAQGHAMLRRSAAILLEAVEAGRQAMERERERLALES